MILLIPSDRTVTQEPSALSLTGGSPTRHAWLASSRSATARCAIRVVVATLRCCCRRLSG